MDYYLRFIKRFPDVRSLATASEMEVLKLWQGLGYYTRARNLHAAAREIMSAHRGKFPGSHEEIRKLKGIGDYTAAAIASISFGLTFPVVDGNVFRFFSRYFGIGLPAGTSQGKKVVTEIAAGLIDPGRPGDFNQAVMEFGALQCIPANPECKNCPFSKICYAYRMGKVQVMPVKKKSIPAKNRYFNYLVISKDSDQSKVYIHHRDSNDIWKNLYDFPQIETDHHVPVSELAGSEEWKKIFGKKKTEITGISGSYRHVLTHRVIHARFIRVRITRSAKMPYQIYDHSKKSNYPFPRLIEKYLQNSQI
jgi:A/G-specific adenine glycosylase